LYHHGFIFFVLAAAAAAHGRFSLFSFAALLWRALLFLRVEALKLQRTKLAYAPARTPKMNYKDRPDISTLAYDNK